MNEKSWIADGWVSWNLIQFFSHDYVYNLLSADVELWLKFESQSSQSEYHVPHFVRVNAKRKTSDLNDKISNVSIILWNILQQVYFSSFFLFV